MTPSRPRRSSGGDGATRDATPFAGSDYTVEADDEPDLGMLSETPYAGLFYHCLEADLIPRLDYDARAAWEARLESEE